jgi:hypothetical protein
MYDHPDLPGEESLARRDWSLLLHSTIDKDEDIITLDVGVPLMGGDQILLHFFAPSLGRAVQEFHANVVDLRPPVQFRLLVTRYPSDDSSIEFQEALAKAALLNSTEDVVFVGTKERSFHRSYAITKVQSKCHQYTILLYEKRR